MKHLLKYSQRLCLATLLALPLTGMAANEITIVDRPAMGDAANYPAYRAPLHGGLLLKLPVGKVQPRGWLLEVLNRQKNGLNG